MQSARIAQPTGAKGRQKDPGNDFLGERQRPSTRAGGSASQAHRAPATLRSYSPGDLDGNLYRSGYNDAGSARDLFARPETQELGQARAANADQGRRQEGAPADAAQGSDEASRRGRRGDDGGFSDHLALAAAARSGRRCLPNVDRRRASERLGTNDE